MYWKNGRILPGEFLDSADPTLVPMVYEVFRICRRKPLFLAEHTERMFHSIALLGMDEPYSREEMESYLYELLDTEPDRIGNIKIRLSWWPDPVLEIGYIPHRYPTLEEQAHGVAVSTFHAVRDLPNVKLWNAALKERTSRFLQETGVYEVLLVNESGYITEGGRTNLFFVKDGLLCTAPLESVLPGVTRQKIIELASNLGIPLMEDYLHESDVGLVNEMFTTGTSAGVGPVATVNGIRLPEARPVTMRLKAAYDQLVEQILGPDNYGIQ